MHRIIVLASLAGCFWLEAITITISEINNQSNSILTARAPLYTGQVKEYKIRPNNVMNEPIMIKKQSSENNFITSPIIFAEQSMKLFTLEFKRIRKKQFLSGRVTVTLQVIQDGKKVIASKEQGYLYQDDTYDIQIKVNPGEGQVVAEPLVTIHASYQKPTLDETNDWEVIAKN